MEKIEKYEVKLSEEDIYWITELLKDFMMSGKANIEQIEICLTLYKKIKHPSNSK
jgi:septation ring formation regulator EzrA